MLALGTKQVQMFRVNHFEVVFTQVKFDIAKF
jgi:hypothetical protein